MTKQKISGKAAADKLLAGESIDNYDVVIDQPIDAMDAFHLQKQGFDVPEHLITYNDEDIAYGPEFDDHEWERTDIDPVALAETPLTLTLDVPLEVRVWLEEENINTAELLSTLLEQFYEARKLVN